MEIKKYLERIKKEKEEENEYNKTQVTEYQIKTTEGKHSLGPNEGNVLRIINKNDTSANSKSYHNTTKAQNLKRLQNCLGGM